MSRSNDQFQYRGVEYDRRTGKYSARTRGVEEKGKQSSIGTFDTAQEAAMAYDYAVRSIHGSNAYTNFVYPDGRHRGSLTNITAPHEPEYELSPNHAPAPAPAGYNYGGGSGYNYGGGSGYNSGYQQSYLGQGEYQQNSGFGQVEYPQWAPGDELPPLPQDLTSSSVGYGGGYMPPPGAGGSYSGGGGYGYGYGNGWQ